MLAPFLSLLERAGIIDSWLELPLPEGKSTQESFHFLLDKESGMAAMCMKGVVYHIYLHSPCLRE
jgi:hypothetical protein